MRFISRCRFLKLELNKSKENKEYCVVSLLDDDNNSYKFFLFEDLKNKILSEKLNEFDFLDCAFEAYTYNDNGKLRWIVKFIDFKKVDNNGK